MFDPWFLLLVAAFIIGVITMFIWDTYCSNRNRPSFVTRYDTKVYEDSVPWISISDVELLQDLVLVHYVLLDSNWTRENILRVFAAYEIHFTSFPVIIGMHEPVRGISNKRTTKVCWDRCIYMTTLAHEVIHVLRLSLSGAANQDEIDHVGLGWKNGKYNQAVDAVQNRLKALVTPPQELRH